MYQSSFHYKQNAEWTGELIRTAVDSDGNINTADSGNWSAKAKMPNPDSRKIWTTLKEKDYSTDYNKMIRKYFHSLQEVNNEKTENAIP